MENFEFKGTKGLWDFNIDCVFTDDVDNIGNIICENPTWAHQSSINWEANAKLIVCSTEMLETLKEAYKVICELQEYTLGNNHFIDIGMVQKCLAEIEKLLKKATK